MAGAAAKSSSFGAGKFFSAVGDHVFRRLPSNTHVTKDAKQANGYIREAVRTYSIVRLPANSMADLSDLGFTADVNDVGHPRPPSGGGYGITYYDNAYACFFSFEFC
jgi:hypothetical protein